MKFVDFVISGVSDNDVIEQFINNGAYAIETYGDDWENYAGKYEVSNEEKDEAIIEIERYVYNTIKFNKEWN